MHAESGTGAAPSGGYSRVVPVDRHKLQDLGVDQASCSRFASCQITAYLNLVEFFHVLPYYPIAFIRSQQGMMMPVAVLGLNAGENLFTDREGKWQEGVYSPAYIRRYPFLTEPVSPEELDSSEDCRKPILVDETALDNAAPSLFIANGVATAEWEKVETFISDYISAERLTLSFTRKLDALKLLEPFDAQIHPATGDKVTLQGMYRVNESRLNGLPAKSVKEMMQTGELSRIYAHLISLENFAKLLDRSASRNNTRKQQ